MKNKQKIVFPIFFIIAIFGIYFINFQNQTPPSSANTFPVPIVSPTVNPSIDNFKYQGKDGVDALTLLKQNTVVKQDSTGMVVSISGRQADNSQREFWSFYINGESAQVGSASYITKNNDIISWKIEKY